MDTARLRERRRVVAVAALWSYGGGVAVPRRPCGPAGRGGDVAVPLRPVAVPRRPCSRSRGADVTTPRRSRGAHVAVPRRRRRDPTAPLLRSRGGHVAVPRRSTRRFSPRGRSPCAAARTTHAIARRSVGLTHMAGLSHACGALACKKRPVLCRVALEIPRRATRLSCAAYAAPLTRKGALVRHRVLVSIARVINPKSSPRRHAAPRPAAVASRGRRGPTGTAAARARARARRRRRETGFARTSARAAEARRRAEPQAPDSPRRRQDSRRRLALGTRGSERVDPGRTGTRAAVSR